MANDYDLMAVVCAGSPVILHKQMIKTYSLIVI